jgi:Sec-independent protein translocase protein TatA
MLSLSPAKLLVVLVIALIVLGPEKLPELSRQLGSLWGDLRKWRTRLESEVRSNFPDLPSTDEVVHAVRSPLSLLDRLADAHEGSQPQPDPAQVAVSGGNGSQNGGAALPERPPPQVSSSSASAAPGDWARDGRPTATNEISGEFTSENADPDGSSHHDPEAAEGSGMHLAADWGHDDPSMN